MATINKQISDVKQRLGQDVICLFSGKRFYEAYCDDAKIVSECCVNTMKDSRTSEGCVLDMVAFSNKDLDINLPKLVRAGYRVAICDMPVAQGRKIK